MPGTPNVCSKAAPCESVPDEKLVPSSDVIVCGEGSWFVQRTVVPAATVRAAGLNANPLIETVWVPACTVVLLLPLPVPLEAGGCEYCVQPARRTNAKARRANSLFILPPNWISVSVYLNALSASGGFKNIYHKYHKYLFEEGYENMPKTKHGKPFKVKTITVRQDQATFIEENCINLSRFIQTKLDERMGIKRGGK